MTTHCAVCQPYLRSDRDAILDLWARNLPEASPARWTWLYERGPASSWLAHDEHGSPIGSIGLMSRTIEVFGEPRSAGQPIDLNVDRRHRLGAAALALQRIVTDQVEQGSVGLVYGLPNAQSEPVLRRVGYRPLAEVGRWAKPLATEGALPGWLGQGPLRRLAAAALDAILWLGSREHVVRRPRGARFEVTDRFDARFDRLWQTARHQFPVVAERSAEYLDWRFVRCPEVCHRAFCLTSPHDELLAYLVYSVRDSVAHVSDFLFGEPAHFDLLLAEFLRTMRQEHARAVVTIFTGAGWVGKHLRRFGFRPRPSSWKVLLHAEPSRLGAVCQSLFDVENWFLTRADVDTDF